MTVEVQMKGVPGWSAILMCALVAAALMASEVGAQDQETRKITLKEAIETAAERNISSIQASNRVASGKVSVHQAAAQFLPDLSASASGSRRYTEPAEASASPGSYATSSSVTARMSSSLTLFDGLGNINSLRAAQLGLRADQQSYEHARQTVIFQTASSFLNVLMNRELVQSQRENLEAQRQHLALIEEFYKVGNRSLADLLQQQAAVAQAELQVFSAEQAEGVSKLQLLQTMGIEPTVGYEAVPLPVDQLNLKLEAPDADSALQEALVHRADLAGEKAQVEVASRQVTVARSGYWPSLSLSVGGTSSYSSQNETDGLSHQMLETKPELNAGLSFSVPVFDRLSTRSNVQQAQITLRNEKLNLEDLERQVTLDVRQALLDYETAVKRLRAADAQLQYAQQALAATTERYRVGAATLVELTASRAQYANARTERVQAGYSIIIAWLATGYYKGDIDAALGLLG